MERLREATVGKFDRFLKSQATMSRTRAWHSRVVLSLMFGFALRQEAVRQNPVVGTARLKNPRIRVRTLTLRQLEQIRDAAAS